MRDISEIGFIYHGKVVERPCPNDVQIAQIECRIGVPLPDDYKKFLSKQNGGIPKLNYVPLKDDRGFLIETFNYVDGKEEDIYDIEKASRWPSEDLSRQVVAIASDGSGDCLILVQRDNNWQIEHWRHDEGTTEQVASSFSELLDMITKDPIE